jgi:uncharacterized membrane protein
MKRESKNSGSVVSLLIIAVVILTAIIRICGNTAQNQILWISGAADDTVKVVDSTYLELNLEAPIGGITGFSFEFNGNREEFGEGGFLVTAEIGEEELQEKQKLYQSRIALVDQAFDYQSERFKVMIPFKGEIKQGDHIRIAIMGSAIPEKSGISIKTSSQFGMAGAVFEINDFVQDSMLSGALYYQTKGVTVIPVLRESIVFILLLFLGKEIWEKHKEKKQSLEKQKEKTSSKKNFFPRQNLPTLFVLLVLLVVFDYVYYAGVIPRLYDMRGGKEDPAYEKGETAYMELGDGEALFREMEIEENYLGGLKLYLKEPFDENGFFTIELIEAESQDLILSTKKAVYEMIKKDEEGAEAEFIFDSPIRKSAGAHYLTAIYYSGEPISLLMIDDGQNHPVLTPLYQKNVFLKPLLCIFAILIAACSVIVVICIQNKMKVEKFFLVVTVLLGILFQTVLTPFAVPDEAAHIDTAYRISNRILGIEDTRMKDAIWKRMCDNRTDSGIRRHLSVDSYRWLYEDWFQTEGNRTGQLVYASDTRANADSLFFLPAAVGITVGRILGLGFLPMMFLARTFNLLVCVWMIYLALKKLPFGKSVLCAMALLPITLQEIASCSYDSLIIGIALLYIGYCVFAIYSPRKLEKIDVLTLLITAVMLGMCKGGVYIPLYLLGGWMLIKRGCIRFPQSKKLQIAGVAALIVLVLAGIVILVFLYRQPIDAYSMRYSNYPLAYLVQHPLRTIRIFENTLYGDFYNYLIQCIGIRMGYFQTAVDFITPIGYILLICASVTCDERHPYIIGMKEKCVFLASAVSSVGAVYLAFFISNTRFGDIAISGIQGRYFIPVLWLVLISMRNGKIVHKKKRYRRMVSIGYVLGVCTVIQVVINTLIAGS